MRRITVWLWAVLASLTLAMASTSALAKLPDRPAGPVLDAATIIPDADEAALDARLRAYNQETGRAIIVATVTSLDDLPVDAYAQQLAETWDIGGAESEQGILFLIAPTERKIRIHAARGVQERLPDVLAGRIIRDTVAPRFKANDMAGGIGAGVDAIMAQLSRDPADAKAVAEAAAAAEAVHGRDEPSGGAVVFWIMMILFFMLMFGRRGRRGYRRSGIDPGVILWGLSEIAHHASRGGGRGGGFDFGGGGSGGFGGFGGGGGGFDGGGASGSW